MTFRPRTVNRRVLVACLSLLFLTALGSRIAPESLKPRAASPVRTESLIGHWSSPIPMPAIPIHTHVLPNKKVLFWGRDQVGGADVDNKSQPYVWNPATPAATPVAVPTPATNLFCSGHAFLQDGRLFVAGGHDKVDNEGERHTNIFNPVNNTWTAGPAMNAGRWYPTSTALNNGEILTVSGTYWDGLTLNQDGSHKIQKNELPQVRTTTGALRDLTAARTQMVNAQRSISLYPWMMLAPDGRVFQAGPEQVKSFISAGGSGGWADAGRNSLYPFRDAGSAVMYEPGKVLIVGGGGPPTNTAETIDLNTANGWQWTGSMQYPRRHMNATILADGKVLATGGTSVGNGMDAGFNDASGSVLPAEMWDPATGAWTTMASMAVRRLYHSTAVLLPDGTVLSAGGGGPPGSNGDSNHLDAEIYSPPYLFRGQRPTITSAPNNVKYGETFFVGTPEAAGDMTVSLVRLSSVTHSFNENQRFMRLSHPSVTLAAGGLNVTAPTNKNALPPGHYMLFILNGSGVPSVARIISVQDYEGSHEVADCNQISGWAWNRNDPNTPINVDIFAGSTHVATVAANLYRQDLFNAGKGDGRHAFVYNVPSHLRNGQMQTISVRYAGSYSNLVWSPRSMICGASLFPNPSGTITSVSGGGSTWEQATQFSSTMSGKVTHIRFFKVPQETGSHVGRIWSDTGAQLVQQPFTGETASGWQEVQLTTPLQITAGVRYRVSYNVNSYGGKILGGLGSPITNGPLTAHTGLYTTPAGTFPNTGSVSNFLADIKFSAP